MATIRASHFMGYSADDKEERRKVFAFETQLHVDAGDDRRVAVARVRAGIQAWLDETAEGLVLQPEATDLKSNLRRATADLALFDDWARKGG
ncbi:MAG: hypothetical protein Q8L48_16605 [Archangium sp.]|nr:hypothetical protein [Archangium sp.]